MNKKKEFLLIILNIIAIFICFSMILRKTQKATPLKHGDPAPGFLPLKTINNDVIADNLFAYTIILFFNESSIDKIEYISEYFRQKKPIQNLQVLAIYTGLAANEQLTPIDKLEFPVVHDIENDIVKKFNISAQMENGGTIIINNNEKTIAFIQYTLLSPELIAQFVSDRY